jgi:hypothetical protein
LSVRFTACPARWPASYGPTALEYERNDCALSLLSIKPTDRVLESVLAWAVGKAAANAAEVVGLDRSALIVRQATRRHKQLIEKGVS